jgi:hypothetical protein
LCQETSVLFSFFFLHFSTTFLRQKIVNTMDESPSAISRFDRQRNTNIHGKLQVPYTARNIRQYQRNRRKYVARTEEDFRPILALQCHPCGYCHRGTPQLLWTSTGAGLNLLKPSGNFTYRQV